MSIEKALALTDSLLPDGAGGGGRSRGEGVSVVVENESQQIVICDCMS